MEQEGFDCASLSVGVEWVNTSTLVRIRRSESKGIIMFALIAFGIIAAGTLAATAGTIVMTAKDGYRRIPTRQA